MSPYIRACRLMRRPGCVTMSWGAYARAPDAGHEHRFAQEFVHRFVQWAAYMIGEHPTGERRRADHGS